MICNYFGFTKKPFSRDVTAEEMFRWKEFEDLKQRLAYFLKEGGMFLLSGSIGSGKTSAIKYFAHSINPNTHSVLYFNTMFESKKDFFRSMISACGMTPSFYISDCRGMLKKYFLEMQYVKKITSVVIFDEAQNIPGFLLEEIRLLGNFDFDSSSPVLFIIAGHRLLQQRIALHENEALRQRFTLKFLLQGMTLEETCGYIRHRLGRAGSTGSIFADAVLGRIHEESAGIPRLVNNICNALLLAAVVSEKKVVDEFLFEQTRDEWK